MTSQVAVYNMNGIAIASDTVVTSNSKAGAKTTANSEKIYEVGEGHKILVMHYGGTKLNDVNHQFHFAEWALTLNAPLKTIGDYVDAYVKWSSVGRKFHSSDSERDLMISIINEHFDYVKGQIDEAYNSDEFQSDLTAENHEKLVLELNKKESQFGMEYLKSRPMYPGLSEVTASEAIKASKIDLGKFVDEAFEGYVLNSSIKTILKNSAIATVARRQPMDWDSYLAFVGYGADDPFPSVQVLVCRGYYAGQLVCVKEDQVSIEPGGRNSEIYRFAQSEAILAFLQGYNADILRGIKFSIGKEMALAFPNQEKLVGDVSDKVVEYIEGHSWRTYIKPILRQVEGMSLYALAELARTLVSIQATFSESQDGPVTVGGLIEVVTVDRVNGVMWKQRLPR
jgi:hypothetical protein